MRIAVLSSYTFDTILAEAKKQMPDENIEWLIAPFNQYRQEILDDNSVTLNSNPDVIIFAVSCETQLQDGESFFETIRLASAKCPSATIFVHNCAPLEISPIHFLQWNQPDSETMIIADHNLHLVKMAGELPNVKIQDITGLVMRYGHERMFDHRFWYFAKMLWSAFGSRKIAEQIVTAVKIIKGKRKKCLVLDLDNTLWGGVVGDVGIEGIVLSNDGEGKIFYDFQKIILKLFKTGIIMAICSKNEEDIAVKAIKEHPYMILRENYFAAIRINWTDKVTNIKSIADELNIGLDSIVFLDDSEHERNFVRAALPEVEVPDMPKDFAQYPVFLANLPFFETFNVTNEDIERGKLYVDERKRNEKRQEVKSLEEFLGSLNIVLKTEPVNDFSIPRIAQLTQRTNQFNFTTRRYSEAQIKTLAGHENWLVLSAQVIDSIGDAGIVGVAIIEINNGIARLDTFLMSCRVLGRGIEDALLADIANRLRKKNVSRIHGEFIPSPKNKPAEKFFQKNDFIKKDNFFEIDIEKASELLPKWVALEERE